MPKLEGWTSARGGAKWMAVAGAQDDPCMLHPKYAEGMGLVFDEYFGRSR